MDSCDTSRWWIRWRSVSHLQPRAPALLCFLQVTTQKPYEINKIPKYFWIRLILSSRQMVNLKTQYEPFAARSTCSPFNCCLGHNAITVKDRKIAKTDLDSFDSVALEDYEFGNVPRAICSQEHLPSIFMYRSLRKIMIDNIFKIRFGPVWSCWS